jgi:inorganic phosphate transporter, PiT family
MLLGDFWLFGEPLALGAAFFLLLALGMCLAFEFVNGFHDTANAVATVIYTHTLKPTYAVVWSGIWNLIGVLCSSGAVAYSIVALLPVELVLRSGSGAGFAMIFALLISAIIWNVGTWYLGLPASSSHTMIGAIMGVGVANSMIHGNGWMAGINWHKAQEIGAALLLSPVVGFVGAGLLLITLKLLVHRKDLFEAPDKDSTPPLWIRGVLMLTCTGVSYAHGSNDGQKGMGLIMLVLVGLVPTAFALNLAHDPARLPPIVEHMRHLAETVRPLAKGAKITLGEAMKELERYDKHGGKPTDATYAAIALQSEVISFKLDQIPDIDTIPHEDRVDLRSEIFLVAECIDKLVNGKWVTEKADVEAIRKDKKELDGLVKYIPPWVKYAVAVALGLGTMIGWKRIVVTVGEKIGKSHLTYAQGASAEFMAAATIGLAETMGLPVSTTHVLSSGIAGCMAANRSGLQKDTLISILMAWVLTLPVCIFLGATIFATALYVTLHFFGIQ